MIEWAERVVIQAEYLRAVLGRCYKSTVHRQWQYVCGGEFLDQDTYPDEKQDLYACFIVRSDELVPSGGFVALVTGDTWMTIKSFEKLRRRLLAKHAFLSFVHMHDVSNHPDIFGANTAFVMAKDGRSDTVGTFVYLDATNSETKAQHLREAVRNRESGRVFLAQSSQFEEVPGAPLVFRISAAMRRAFHAGQPLLKLAEPRQGMATAEIIGHFPSALVRGLRSQVRPRIDTC